AAIDEADRLVEEAEAIGYKPLLAKALLYRGKLSLNLTAEVEPQFETLQRALYIALESKVDEVAAEAMAHMLFVRGRLPGGAAARALEDLDHYRAFVSRLPSANRLRGLLLNNAAVVTYVAGDVVGARALHEEALRAKQAGDVGELEIAYTVANLALLEDDPDAKAQRMRDAVQMFERALGPRHPTTIQARLSASSHTRDPLAAREILRPGCDAILRYSPTDPPQLALCLASLAHHSAEAGDDEEARAALRRAVALLSEGSVEGGLVRAVDVTLIRGLAALDGEGSAEAVEDLRQALADRPGDAWWRRIERAELELVLGLHLRKGGDLAGAAEALQAAIDGFVAAEATVRDVLREQRLARARVALADVLLAAPRPGAADLDRAAELLAEATRWYREGGDAYASRLGEVRALEATLAMHRSERRARQ
ncbi:MAG TPA: hypothetical protein VIK91_27945, partial [Nannocystis sp.]